MKLISKKSSAVLLMSGILLVTLVLINSCEKSEPGMSESTATEMGQEMAEHEAMTTADVTMSEVAAAMEQTTCPVMEGAINKDIFVEYQGKKVYFCCAGCEKIFKEDPEKYIAKLPQFQEE